MNSDRLEIELETSKDRVRLGQRVKVVEREREREIHEDQINYMEHCWMMDSTFDKAMSAIDLFKFYNGFAYPNQISTSA